MTSSDQPVDNLRAVLDALKQAAAGGAQIALTPEVTNCVSTSRQHQRAVLSLEEHDPVLAGIREAAAAHGLWVLIGSLALKLDRQDRFANRSILVAPDGRIVARYDKIHMFDVQIDAAETYRESDGFRPGDRTVVARTPCGVLGLSICYDLRFPQLYRALGHAGAQILTVPAAFSPVTGRAHWEVLLRARAIETGCFVLAPAQTGRHPASAGRARQTHGHSLAVTPWGEILCDAGTATGVTFVDLDLDKIGDARAKVPSLDHDREFSAPQVVEAGFTLDVT